MPASTKNIIMHNVGLVLLALFLNLLFFSYGSSDLYHAITQAHGNIGYNFFHNSTIGINPRLADYVRKHHAGDQLFNYDQLPNDNFGVGEAPFPVNDTIGYGIVLGLLWKLTNSNRFTQVQILQIILYCLSVPLFYQIALMLFNSSSCALVSSLSFLFFFPLIALNVQAVRDVWAYYGLIVLIFTLLMVLVRSKSIGYFIVGSIWFALCQWIRPSLFLAVITLSFALCIVACMRRISWHRAVTLIAMLVLTNLTIFWLPFLTYNKKTYNRYFVGPVGQDLLEGLGEFSNPWGYQLNDEFVADYIGKKYGVAYGTPEFDDKARAEFAVAYAQQPLLYWRNIVYRIPMLVLPGLPWIFYKNSPYSNMQNEQLSSMQKLKLVVFTPALWLDFLLRHIYIRFFLLIGYAGMLLAFVRRRYDLLLLIAFGVICAGWGKLPSHIEYRYLVPFYWAFSLFVGYAWYSIFYLSHADRSTDSEFS